MADVIQTATLTALGTYTGDPENVRDGNLATSWSTEGEVQVGAIIFDFAAPTYIEQIFLKTSLFNSDPPVPTYSETGAFALSFSVPPEANVDALNIFADNSFLMPAIRKISCIGDSSSHGGTITTTGGNSTVSCAGDLVAINGALHSCPITGHGITAITAVTIKSYVAGELILTDGAVAGCGAVITSPDRGVYVE